MTPPRRIRLALSLLAPLAFGLHCAHAPPPRLAKPSPDAPTPKAVAVARAPEDTPVPAASPPRPPPPVISTPMAGEPAAALSEARLVTSSCENYQQVAREQAQARIKQMRADVDASLRDWHESQPDCWAEYAEQERESKSGSGYGRAYGGMAGGSIGMGSMGMGSMGMGIMGKGYPKPVSQPSFRPAPPRPAAKSPAPSAQRAAPRAAESASGATPRAAESASGTNNQVAGVDEADIVKTDGRYVYLSMNGALRIVEALHPRVISVTKLSLIHI